MFKEGKLGKVNRKKLTSLEECLVEDFRINKTTSKWLSNFLTPMMNPDPFKRKSAFDCLSNQWIVSPNSPRGSFFMSDLEWHESLWNPTEMEDPEFRLKGAIVIGSDKEDGDIGEFSLNDSEVSFGRPVLHQKAPKVKVAEKCSIVISRS